MTAVRLAGRVAGVPRAPRAPSLIAWTAWCWSGVCGRALMRFQAVTMSAA